MSIALDQTLIDDGKSLALFGVTALKNAVDSALGKSTEEVPKITGDAVAAVEQAIEQHAPASAQGFLKIALGLAGGAVDGVEKSVDVTVVAALHQTSVSVDAAFAVLGGKLH